MLVKHIKPRLFPEHGNINNRKHVKLGIDPTSSRLHLGHLVPLLELKRMRDQSKDITVVLGGFTAILGDPTGVNKTRPILTRSQVQMNTAAIREQIHRVLGPVRVKDNADMAESFSAGALVSEAVSKFTLAEIMERDDFKNRPIGLHELIVPIFQAMDSILLETDLEIGGEDQLLNFSLTRKLQERMGLEPEVCVLTQIINGTNGKKMSKSSNNCIFLDETKSDIRRKVLNSPDESVDHWIGLMFESNNWPDHPKERKEVFTEEVFKII